MQNPDFENLLSLLKHESTFEVGLELAQHYQKEFQKYFGCDIENYRVLMSFFLIHAPENFGKSLKHIKDLHLPEGNFFSLPPNIHLLTKLEGLNLYCNGLTSVPEEVCRLKKLKSLDLSDNQLTTLPKEN